MNKIPKRFSEITSCSAGSGAGASCDYDNLDSHHHHHVTHVPKELVNEILLRLPVRSLLCSKAVCKLWYNLITSSNFINNHFRRNNNNHNTRILAYLHDRNKPSPTTLFKAFLDESLAPDHPYLDYLRIPLLISADILDPVNGLFLIRHQFNRPGPDCTRLALLNPATRDLKLLSVPDSNSIPHFWPFMQRIGFGFDHLTNDFKVVAFWELEDRVWEHPGYLMNKAVYSLANDSWKHMDHYSRTTRNTPGFGGSVTAYLNGACHWLLDDHSILSFDIGSEVFREIKGPHNPPSPSTIASLFLYNNDSLAMFIYTYHRRLINSIDLMVMREEGCWTKHLMVNVSLLQVIKPLGVWKNNKLFLETRDKYEFKRIKTHSYKNQNPQLSS